MTETKEKSISARVEASQWEAFVERCKLLDITPSAAIAAFVRSGAQLPEPEPDTRPLGFDPINGEPIFKRGVGPQKGKK